MMTIEEVNNISFRKSGRAGYNAEDVDNFIDEVVRTLKQYESEKAEIMKKIDFLAKKIESYRNDEEVIRNALLRAEKVSEATVAEAKEKSEKMISDAQKQAEKIVADANNATAKQKKDLVELQKLSLKFREELVEKYKAQIKLVTELPNEQETAAAVERIEKQYPYGEQTAPASPQEKPQEKPQQPAEEENRRVSLDAVTPAPEAFEAPRDIGVETTKTKNFTIKSSSPSQPQEDGGDAKAPAAGTKRASRFSVLKFGDNYELDE